MRNALLVLAALAMVGCASGTVRGHATSARDHASPAMDGIAAPHGVNVATRPAAAAPLSRGTLAAINAYRGTSEPAVLHQDPDHERHAAPGERHELHGWQAEAEDQGDQRAVHDAVPGREEP
jgi:hypothetical protein